MKLSEGERLILAMLCDIYKSQKIKGEFDADLMQDALYGHHDWALDRLYGSVLRSDHDEPDAADEAQDMVDMWRFIERSYNGLDKTDKAKVKAENHGEDVRFEGFDGNEESRHMSVASFAVEKMGLWDEFKGRGMNTHFPVVDRYRKMMSVFMPMKKNLHRGDLSADQLIAILKA